jgi:CBS domain-containing protein
MAVSMEESKSAGRTYHFLKTIPPFNLLSDPELRNLLPSLTSARFDKGVVILSPEGPPTRYLYLIRSGGVRFVAPAKEEGEPPAVLDMRGEREFFGFFSLLTSIPSPFQIIAEKETSCLLITKGDLIGILNGHPEVLLYFTMGPSKGFKTPPAPDPAAHGRSAAEVDAEALLFSARVRDMMHTDVATCSSNERVVEAGRRMTARGVGSLVVLNPDSRPIGIITDSDLRRKVIASGRLADLPVEEIMSRPLSSVSPGSFLFESLLMMIRRRIKYLPVMEGQELRGILSERDLVISQGNNPVALIRRIHQAGDIEQVAQIRKEINHVIKVMMERGGQAREICQLITQLNDQMTVRIVQLAEDGLAREGRGKPPRPFLWMALGSEGRQEQTLSTDQDNALIFADSGTGSADGDRDYFLALAERVVSGLEWCGFPRCNGEIMGSNPKWCQPLSVWKEYYRKWIFQRDLSAQDILISSIFFDFRHLYGSEQLMDELLECVRNDIPRSKVFLPHMALRSLELQPPLSFFNRLVVEKSGKYKNHLNIKRHGLMPLLDAVRILALEQGIFKTNTLERIDGLIEKGVFSQNEGNDLREAFNLMMLVRVRHHLKQMNQGKPLDNYIQPSELSMIQRSMLKISFKTIERLQSQIEIRFGLTALRNR